MKTSERILVEALNQLNELGPAKVTTNGIADGADISVGNLYYHYKNKDEMIVQLLKRFQQRLDPLLTMPEQITLDDWVSWWLRWFALAESYRFIFLNQNYLVEHIEHVRFLMQQVTASVEEHQKGVFSRLKMQGVMVATLGDTERLARQVTFIAFFWQDFSRLLPAGRLKSNAEQAALTQILGLILPYLRASDQLQVEQLMKLA